MSDEEKAKAAFFRGLDSFDAGNFGQAAEFFEEALKLAPDRPSIMNNLLAVYLKLHRRQEARDLAEAISFRHGETRETLLAKGILHLDKGMLAESVRFFEQALDADGEAADAWSNLGYVLARMGRGEEAERACRKAVELDPDTAEWWVNLGGALISQGRNQDAEAAGRRAVELEPASVDGWELLGTAAEALHRYGDAAQFQERAIALEPERRFLAGNLLNNRQKICDWRSFEADRSRLLSAIESGQPAVTPFHIIAMTSSARVQFNAAELFVRHEAPPRASVEPNTASPEGRSTELAGGKVRIGYFSADFHNHATSYLMAELLERHDRTRFDITVFSFGPDVSDEMRSRVSGAVDRFIDVHAQPEEEIARLSRDLKIDIAVDLKGYTQLSRPGIFSWRAAPVQVSFLGYPGTSAASYMDYLIGDRIVVPDKSRRWFSEKIVYLPNSYQPNDTKRVISAVSPGRVELGLPQNGFVFCSFNQSYKITPTIFDSWMRLLRNVEGSVFWLLEENADAIANLRKEAAARCVDPDRLVFAGRLALGDHLARMRAADLMLDTFPCNAHTTASDALWAGLPILTLSGEAFASRVAASLLSAVGLPELITDDHDSYEARALELAWELETISRIKTKLRDGLASAPLFDTERYTRHIEAAFLAMHKRRLGGLAPDDMIIDA